MKAILSSWTSPILIGSLYFGLPTPHLWARDRVSAEVHESYPLSADGVVRLKNVNGKVHITSWDRPEIQVDAVKHADNQAELEAVKIQVDARPDRVAVQTELPKRGSGWWWWRSKGSSASVDYEIKVPSRARLEAIETVNGNVEIESVRGQVNASSVNGRLSAKGLAGETRLESVNGRVEASFDALAGVKLVLLKTVNGRVELVLPADADAVVFGKTLNGSIHANGGLTVKQKWPVSSELHGQLGKGGTEVKVETLNGGIRVQKSETKKAALAEQPE